MRTRTAVGLWTVALFVAAVATALVLLDDDAESGATTAVLSTAVGLAFVGAGLVAWYRRPENRTGVLMVLVGFTWFLGALTASDRSVPFTLGVTFELLAWGVFAYLIFAFPSGRLEGRLSRVIVAGAFLVVTAGRFLWVLFNDLSADYPGAPENAFLVEHDQAVSRVIETTVQVTALLLIGGTVVELVRRWRAASPPLRRALAPVFLTFGASVVTLAAWVAVDVFDLRGEDELYWGALAALLTVPLAFLLGLLRTRLARAGVGRLLVELGGALRPGELREAIARALGDPTLEIAYRLDEEVYVDVEGNRVELPPEGDRRTTTMVEREGRCVAALIHDASLRDDPALIDAVAAAAGLALENEQRLAALAESEARNSALLDAIPDLMFRMTGDGTYLDVKGNEADLAAPAHELVGANIFDVLPHEEAERIMRCAKSVLARGAGVEAVEYQLRLGSLNRHFEGRVVPSGKDEVLLIVRDISERKRAEAQLQRLQDELHARLDELRRERDFVREVVQASASIFCVVTPSGRVVRFNRALEELSGYQDDERVRGRHFWDLFVTPAEAAEVRRILVEVGTGGQPGEHESRWRSRSGGERVVAWSATRLRDADGRPRTLISGLDITARKRQEEELRRLYRELEDRLQELQASRARIVEAGDVERRRLERNLHDGAQQRLVAISISLRLAQATVHTDTDAAASILAAASDELARALEELRELARGIHPAVLTDRGLAPALQALVARTPLPVTLAGAPEDRLPEPVEAAAYYVVSEALANMTKYARASAATVRVSRDDGRAVVEVADDGVGGADPSRGSGLRGLADRVEALDGRLDVESRPGRGTTVRAEIPFP